MMLHDWSKSLVTEINSSVDDFITGVLRLLNPVNEGSTKSGAKKEDQLSDVIVIGLKRQSISSCLNSKKFKYINDCLDEEIERHKKGINTLFAIHKSYIISR